MPTSTEEIDIAKLLINGRQGRAFRDFDRDMKEWLKAEYMHMSKYFYTGTRKKVAQRQKNRRKRYADEIYNLLDAVQRKRDQYKANSNGKKSGGGGAQRSLPRRGAATHHACPAWYPFRAPSSPRLGAGGQEFY